MATMDDLIDEMLAEYEPRFIFDEPIPEDEERRPPPPPTPGHFYHSGHLPIWMTRFIPRWGFQPTSGSRFWYEIEVDGASEVFTTWRSGKEDPLDIGYIKIADGMHARAGRLSLKDPHDRREGG